MSLATQTPDSRTDVIVSWARAHIASDRRAYIDRLCSILTTFAGRLSCFALFPDARALLAYVLLDDFARERGLCVAELVHLLENPYLSGMQAATELQSDERIRSLLCTLDALDPCAEMRAPEGAW